MNEGNDMQVLPKARFNWDFNLGHAFIVASMLGSALVFAIVSSYNIAAYRTEMENKQIELQRGINASEERAKVYVPLVNSMQQTNQIQDERINNIATAITEIRRINSDTNDKLSNMREDMASIKAKLHVSTR